MESPLTHILAYDTYGLVQIITMKITTTVSSVEQKKNIPKMV